MCKFSVVTSLTNQSALKQPCSHGEQEAALSLNLLKPAGYVTHQQFNLLKPIGHVMHQQFNIQELYALPTLYLCVLYLSENKQRLAPLTA